MRYSLEISRTAEKQLKRLPATVQRRVAAMLLSFEIEPRPIGCKKLSGFENTYRVRLGDYRIIYEIHDRIVTVTALKIGHRKDIYR